MPIGPIRVILSGDPVPGGHHGNRETLGVRQCLVVVLLDHSPKLPGCHHDPLPDLTPAAHAVTNEIVRTLTGPEDPGRPRSAAKLV